MTSDVTPRRLIGPWRLADLPRLRPNGLRVFSTFICGGGSTMGYKLAGCEVLGGVEIDPEMMSVYKANHRPQLAYLEGVQDFITRVEIDPRLQDLDILDGSPPCSSFSTSGQRHKKWGEAHVFREGQAKQVLDDLFFAFIDLVARLRPRAVIAENVKGLVGGKARGYVSEIFDGFRAAGYGCQLYLLNSVKMGVPQRRERVFFVAVRADVGRRVNLEFNEPVQSLSVREGVKRSVDATAARLLPHVRRGDALLQSADERARPRGGARGSYFGHQLYWPPGPVPTIVSAGPRISIMPMCEQLVDAEIIEAQSFPVDFNFGKAKVQYICGMSVPPYMMQRVALEVARQVFDVAYDARPPALSEEVFA